ncbi:hypothetical protein DICVIV_03978 [Dictyocaulus viviparus]|uniref:TRPM SLOG domain-containing protein n=1 Tax=Dictyocaulus viviparus TaxID=29172 RepID=A0A0D8Y145_DICVI|nr:hypothetical protein DICVIV_03978 [Dictyocaulus viviparus]
MLWIDSYWSTLTGFKQISKCGMEIRRNSSVPSDHRRKWNGLSEWLVLEAKSPLRRRTSGVKPSIGDRDHLAVGEVRHSEEFRKGRVVIDFDFNSDTEHHEEKSKRKTHTEKKIELSSAMSTKKPSHSCCDRKDTVYLTDSRQKKRVSDVSQTTSVRKNRSRTLTTKSNTWIEHNLKKRECCRFIPLNKYSTRCGCGMAFEQHSPNAQKSLQDQKFLTIPEINHERLCKLDGRQQIKDASRKSNDLNRWAVLKDTKTTPTDSYGTIIFEGSAHHSRAQFVRVSFDTEPASISYLLHEVWKLPQPKLIITIHGAAILIISSIGDQENHTLSSSQEEDHRSMI